MILTTEIQMVPCTCGDKNGSNYGDLDNKCYRQLIRLKDLFNG